MGIFNKLKESAREYNEKVAKKNEESKQKDIQKINGYVEIILNESGLKRGGAKGKLLGSNKFAKVYPQYKVDYVGGYFESPKGRDDINIVLLPQGILMEGLYIGDFIPVEDIYDVSLRTESEIQKDVTLTRMVAFGIYSLALKKKKKVVTNYLVLSCKRNNMDYSVVFGGKHCTNLYTEMFKLLSEVK